VLAVRVISLPQHRERLHRDNGRLPALLQATLSPLRSHFIYVSKV
jgi:hypothetical protein